MRIGCDWRSGRLAVALTVLQLSFLAVSAFASDHVIAVDVSGSMRWNEAGQIMPPGGDEPMRIDIVRPRLLHYLSCLPNDSRVYLMAFNNGIVSQDEFVLSRSGHRERMLAWVKALNPPHDSRTYLWYTLRKALQKAREYAAQAPGQWVSIRVITDGENDHPGSDLTLTKVLDEFPEIAKGVLRPDLVLLGSLQAEFLVPIEQEQQRGRVNMIRPKSMEDPFPPVIKTHPDPVVAGQGAMVLDDSQSTFATYTWYVDDQRVSTEKSFEYTFPKPGQVRVRVEAIRHDGSRDTASRTISVVPVPVFAAFYVPSDIIAGKTVTFVSRASGNVAKNEWFVDDAKIADSQDCEHTFERAGEHQVKLVVYDTAGNAQESVQKVVVGAPPPSPAKPAAGFKIVGSKFKAGEPIQFMDDSTGLVAQYKWSFSGAGVSTEKNPVFTFAEPGEKRVEIVVVGPGGSTSAVQTVDVAPRFVAPTVTFTAEPRSGHAPLEVHFKASVEGDYDSLLWDFGDGDTSHDIAPVHTYGTPGSFKPKLTAKHAESGLEGVSKSDLAIEVTRPLPWWMRLVVGLIGVLVALMALYAWYRSRNPEMFGQVTWEYEGKSGEVALSGRQYPLKQLDISGWEPQADYYFRNVRGTLTICAKNRTDIPLVVNESATVDGVVFTYKGFD
jgi:PKD repeat protein